MAKWSVAKKKKKKEKNVQMTNLECTINSTICQEWHGVVVMVLIDRSVAKNGKAFTLRELN